MFQMLVSNSDIILLFFHVQPWLRVNNWLLKIKKHLNFTKFSTRHILKYIVLVCDGIISKVFVWQCLNRHQFIEWPLIYYVYRWVRMTHRPDSGVCWSCVVLLRIMHFIGLAAANTWDDIMSIPVIDGCLLQF